MNYEEFDEQHDDRRKVIDYMDKNPVNANIVDKLCGFKDVSRAVTLLRELSKADWVETKEFAGVRWYGIIHSKRKGAKKPDGRMDL